MHDAAAPAAPNLPLSQAYHPTTFLERGVAVPFTTPMLSGTRARPIERGGIELIVPNPAGGRGVYVLPWSGVYQLCRPTVHDTRLNEVVASLPTVTPGTIRKAARIVAQEGLAGREAVNASKQVQATEYEEQVLSNFLLLLELVDQAEPGGLGTKGAPRAHTKELETRAKRALVRIAPRLGLRAEAIAEALEQIAGVFAGIGIAGQTPPPRIIRLIEALTRLHDDALEWGKVHRDESGAQAGMVAAVADLTLSCAARTLAEAHSAARDVPALLGEWRTAPSRLAQRIARTEWLLDGWEQICLIWHCASSDLERRSALAEMGLLVPVLPREVTDWVGSTVDIDLVHRFRKTVSLNVDWRTGAVFERVSRNEKLRALAA